MGIDTSFEHQPDHPIDRRGRYHGYSSGVIQPVYEQDTGNGSTDKNNTMKVQ
jgi:hypothetical protein